MINDYFDGRLVLASEEFPDDQFEKYHIFSDYEEKIIRSLIAHGPVLLRGSRGCGKSALLKEAFLRSKREPLSENIFGVYISLRYLPLLRTKGQEYEKFFCGLLIKYINDALNQKDNTLQFDAMPDVASIQDNLAKLANRMERRIILFFDDAAHIGRETSLKEFFDIFRTLSSNATSCKAAIYPGVTEFGARFDLLNDAIVINVARNEELPYFSVFFSEVIKKRYAEDLPEDAFSGSLTLENVASFIGRAVIGNVRAFIKACNELVEQKGDKKIALLDIESTLKHMAAEFYWPLLEELEPKLGCYAPLIDPTREVAEVIYEVVSKNINELKYGPSFLIHRNYTERLKKIFEMLEYVGFFMKKEASRKLKSGGRGPRYVVNLCILMEELGRLTHNTYTNLMSVSNNGYTEIFRNEELETLQLPEPSISKDLEILSKPINTLLKSKAYPYGLTQNKIFILEEAGFGTVGQLAEASDVQILELDSISKGWLRRIQNLIGQAIWM